jgi:hypothetical protein
VATTISKFFLDLAYLASFALSPIYFNLKMSTLRTSRATSIGSTGQNTKSRIPEEGTILRKGNQELNAEDVYGNKGTQSNLPCLIKRADEVVGMTASLLKSVE